MTCDIISITGSNTTRNIEQQQSSVSVPSKNLSFDKASGTNGRVATSNYLATSLLFEVSGGNKNTKSSSTCDGTNALNILDEALDCLDDSYSSSSNSTFNSFIDEFQVPVKYDGAAKAPRNSPPEKVEMLLDDMKSFEDMLNNATLEDDMSSCCSDYEEEEDDENEENDDLYIPVKFDTLESSTARCRGISSPNQRELMMDNMKSFDSMLELYRKIPQGFEDDEESDEEEEEEYCCNY